MRWLHWSCYAGSGKGCVWVCGMRWWHTHSWSNMWGLKRPPVIGQKLRKSIFNKTLQSWAEGLMTRGMRETTWARLRGRKMGNAKLFIVCVCVQSIKMEASYCNVVSLPRPNPLQMWWKGSGPEPELGTRHVCVCGNDHAKTFTFSPSVSSQVIYVRKDALRQMALTIDRVNKDCNANALFFSSSSMWMNSLKFWG